MLRTCTSSGFVVSREAISKHTSLDKLIESQLYSVGLGIVDGTKFDMNYDNLHDCVRVRSPMNLHCGSVAVPYIVSLVGTKRASFK